MKKTVGTGSATGKIILIGEHSVVYGQPAIAFPFRATSVTTTAVPATQMTLTCPYYTGALADVPEKLENIKASISQTMHDLAKEEPLAFTIKSTIPPERGMGSSAAVAVSVIRSLFDYYDYPYTDDELGRLVAQAEKIAHGNPSGIDAAATSGNHPLYFIKGQPLQPFPMDLKEAWLIVADTGIKGQTRAAVAAIAQLMNQEPAAIRPKIALLGDLTVKSKQLIIANETAHLGAIMDQAQELLTELTVSHPLIDQLVQSAKSAGALGAKLTGGGRGGCMIALSDSYAVAEKIAANLRKNGAVNTWIQSLEEKR